MKQYVLLSNEKGFVSSRQPELVRSDLQLSFKNAPESAHAIINTDKASFYRELVDKSCTVPFKGLVGVLRVTVCVFHDTPNHKRWICEELLAEPREDGSVLVSPNDMNLPQKVTDLFIENEELRAANSKLLQRVDTLEKRFEEMLEGYDLT